MAPRTKWTEAHLAFMREKYPSLTRKGLTIAFNQEFGLERTDAQVTAAVKNYHIQCHRRGKEKLRHEPNSMWPARCLAFLRENYPLMSQQKLTEAFNREFCLERTVQQVSSAVRNYKIRSGRTGHFPQNAVSWNKGTKGLMKPNSGNFKKGVAPKNLKPLGTERIDNRDGFILIKVAEPNPYTNAVTRYKHKHIYLWEQSNGPVPEGMAVMFIDGNKLNCCLENLMLITRAELLRLNKHGYKDAPDEVKPALLMLAKLEAKTFTLLKERPR